MHDINTPTQQESPPKKDFENKYLNSKESDLFKILEDRYYLIKKNKALAILGGAIMLPILTGIISYKAALEAVSSKAAKDALTEIEGLRASANREAVEIFKLKEEGATSVATLRIKLSEAVSLGFQNQKQMPLNEWHLAESDGFALVNVGGKEDSSAKLWTSRDKEENLSGPSRARISGYESEFIIVKKGEYFKATKNEGGTAHLFWIPLFQP